MEYITKVHAGVVPKHTYAVKIDARQGPAEPPPSTTRSHHNG